MFVNKLLLFFFFQEFDGATSTTTYRRGHLELHRYFFFFFFLITTHLIYISRVEMSIKIFWMEYILSLKKNNGYYHFWIYLNY